MKIRRIQNQECLICSIENILENLKNMNSDFKELNKRFSIAVPKLSKTLDNCLKAFTRDYRREMMIESLLREGYDLEELQEAGLL